MVPKYPIFIDGEPETAGGLNGGAPGCMPIQGPVKKEPPGIPFRGLHWTLLKNPEEVRT